MIGTLLFFFIHYIVLYSLIEPSKLYTEVEKKHSYCHTFSKYFKMDYFEANLLLSWQIQNNLLS